MAEKQAQIATPTRESADLRSNEGTSDELDY